MNFYIIFLLVKKCGCAGGGGGRVGGKQKGEGGERGRGCQICMIVWRMVINVVISLQRS